MNDEAHDTTDRSSTTIEQFLEALDDLHLSADSPGRGLGRPSPLVIARYDGRRVSAGARARGQERRGVEPDPVADNGTGYVP